MGADYTFYGCCTTDLVEYDTGKFVKNETCIDAEYGHTTSKNTFDSDDMDPFNFPIKTDIFFHGILLPFDKDNPFVCVSKKTLIKCLDANIKKVKKAGKKYGRDISNDIDCLTHLKDTIKNKFKGPFEDKMFDNVVIHLSC